MVCRHAPACPAAMYPLPTSAEVRSGLEGKDGVFRDDAASGDR